MKILEQDSAEPVPCPGGTGFQPVVSGILPETRGARYAQGLTNTCAIFARVKSGKMPDLTGWKPVPPNHKPRVSPAAP
jgi:hypothetical protein